jgi:hypothetical protein
MDKLSQIIGWMSLVCILKVLAQDPTMRITQTDPPTVPGTQLVVAIRDHDLTMDCYVENLLDTAAVRWQRLYKNVDGYDLTQPISQDMAMDDNIHYSMEKPTQFTWRLRVRSIQVTDEGNYMCFVQVTLSSRVFANRTVSVVYPPFMDPMQTSSDEEIQEGSSLDLSCNATGRPTPLIEWSRLGGTLLPIGQEKFKGMVLKLVNIKPQDRGIYRCTAMNKVSTVIHDIRITVKFKPVVTVGRPVVKQAVGYRAELQCSAEANPFPKSDTNDVAWVKGSTTYSVSSNRYDVRFIQGAFSRLLYELIIHSVREEDYGTYTCRISNRDEKGVATSSGYVVLEKTSVPQPSVKLGRIVSGDERPDSAPASPKGLFLATIGATMLAFFLSK